MMPAEVTSITRDFLVHRMRTFDRAVIVSQAIVKAVESGYEFDSSIPAKKRDTERQRRMRYDGERPLEQYKALVDSEQTDRLLARLEASR